MATTYDSVDDLAEALRRAAAAHGEHEARIGEEDPDWPAWYALYMVRERAADVRPDIVIARRPVALPWRSRRVAM